MAMKPRAFEVHFCWTLSAVEIAESLLARASVPRCHPKSCPLSGEREREQVDLAHSELWTLPAFVRALSHSVQPAVHHRGRCG